MKLLANRVAAQIIFYDCIIIYIQLQKFKFLVSNLYVTASLCWLSNYCHASSFVIFRWKYYLLTTMQS